MSTNKTVVSLKFLLFVSALFSCSHQAAVDEGADLKQSFDELNSYLSENVKVADAEANIEAAHRLLEDEATSKPMREAAELFASLNKVKSNHKCNSESHEILANNIRATGRQVSELSKEADKNRVGQVIYQFAVDLAKHCLHVYPEKFKEKYDSLDSDDGELVETLDRFFLKDIYALHFGQNFMQNPYKNHPISHKSFFRQTDSIDSSQDANVAIKALRFYALDEEEADRKCLYSSSDDCEPAERNRVVGRLFERYLEQPCRRYVALFGPEIFSLVNFDSKFHVKPGMTFSYDSELSYYQSWARFRFCEALIDQRQRRQQQQQQQPDPLLLKRVIDNLLHD